VIRIFEGRAKSVERNASPVDAMSLEW